MMPSSYQVARAGRAALAAEVAALRQLIARLDG